MFSTEHLVSKIRRHTRRTFALNDSHPGGILPIAPTFDNWTRIEAMQQGFTAEVNCAATSDSDPHIRIKQTNVADGIFEVALCCNCTSVSTSTISHLDICFLLNDVSDYRSSLVYGFGGYLASTTCPMSIEDNVISVLSIPLLSLMILLTHHSCLPDQQRGY